MSNGSDDSSSASSLRMLADLRDPLSERTGPEGAANRFEQNEFSALCATSALMATDTP